MRVNHTGEVCAQALYQGQAMTAKLPTVRDEMQQAAAEGLTLQRAPGTASGWKCVHPQGSRFLAREYDPATRRRTTLGTFDTAEQVTRVSPARGSTFLCAEGTRVVLRLSSTGDVALVVPIDEGGVAEGGVPRPLCGAWLDATLR